MIGGNLHKARVKRVRSAHEECAGMEARYERECHACHEAIPARNVAVLPILGRGRTRTPYGA